jgi:hypothetical protein
MRVIGLENVPENAVVEVDGNKITVKPSIGQLLTIETSEERFFFSTFSRPKLEALSRRSAQQQGIGPAIHCIASLARCPAKQKGASLSTHQNRSEWVPVRVR